MKEPVYQPLKNEEEDKDETENTTPHSEWDFLDTATCILKILLWCSLMALFIQLEFGAVFFVVSVFYLMFTNFRKSTKQSGELSAYSVFNPNCEAIKGTLTAEQFENEIKFGLGGLR